MQRRRVLGITAPLACGLAVFATVAGELATRHSPASAQQPVASAQNVTTVNYQGGQFKQTGPKSWTENNGAFNFTEVARDFTSITLFDASRGVELLLNINRKQIFIRGGRSQPSLLYAITGVATAAAPQPPQIANRPPPAPPPAPKVVAAAVNGRNVTLAVHPAGRLRQVGPKAWIEETATGGLFDYEEIGRDETSVTLSGVGRQIRLRITFGPGGQNDLFFTESANGPFRRLNGITSVSAAAITPGPDRPKGPGRPNGPGPEVKLAPTPTAADISALLNEHNRYRARHGAPAMTWSAAIAAGAQKWANAFVFDHDRTVGAPGENLVVGSNVPDMVAVWYDECGKFDPARPEESFELGAAHFTQMVWKATSQLGCGWAHGCRGFAPGQVMMVCRYVARGNVGGAYAQNVTAASCKR